jgi:hypothetical protein
MAGTNAAKNDLMALRDRYLRELVEMARDRDKAQDKLQDILSLERAAESMQNLAPAKYGGFKRAIDAMLDYLDEVGKPVGTDELVTVVIERGFRSPRKDGAAIVRKSISSYTKGLAGQRRQASGLTRCSDRRGDARKRIQGAGSLRG